MVWKFPDDCETKLCRTGSAIWICVRVNIERLSFARSTFVRLSFVRLILVRLSHVLSAILSCWRLPELATDKKQLCDLHPYSRSP